MAGEIKLNDVSVATEDAGTVTVGNSNVTFDANTVTTNLAFAANHAGIKTALNASGNPGIYACRAWVNFNGKGTVAIRDSGNVSSITDNGIGEYTVNFTTAMPDVNYSLVASSSNISQNVIDEYTGISPDGSNTYLVGSVRMTCMRWRYDVQQKLDSEIVTVAIFR